MTQTELYIENSLVDLSEDVIVPLNLWLANIKDIGKRTSSFSKTIRVPGSKRNDELFGHAYNLQTSVTNNINNIGVNFNRKRKASFILIHDGAVLLSGVTELQTVTLVDGVSHYNIVLYGELINLISEIGDLELQDLDGSELEHTYTIPNITGSWDGSTPYLYPLIDYGVNNTRQEAVTITAFRPAVYVKWYWDKIFDEAGFEYESEFINSEFFGNLIIPFNKENLDRVNGLPDVEITNGSLLDTGAWNTYFSVFDEATEDPEGYFDGTVYNTPETDTYDIFGGIRGSIFLDPQNVPDSSRAGHIMTNKQITFTVEVRVNGTQADTSTFIIPQDTLGRVTVESGGFIPAITSQINIPFQFTRLELDENDTVDIRFRYEHAGTDPIRDLTANEDYPLEPLFGLSFNSNQNTSTAVIGLETIQGSLLTKEQIIPTDMKQQEFISGILRLFNLYIEGDKDNQKKLVITQREDYYDTNVIHDWTQKVDTSQEISNEVLKEGLVRTLQLKYKDDEDDYYLNLYKQKHNREYGERRVDTGYEFNRELKDVLELPFGTSVPIQYRGGALAGDTRIEVLDSRPSRIRVFGLTLSIQQGGSDSDPDLPEFERALIGRQVTIGDNTYMITDRVSPWEFVINGAVPVTSNVTVDGVVYRVFNGSYLYTREVDKVVPAIYESEDNNVTRRPHDSTPRILHYNGQITGSAEWTIQQEPIQIEGSPNYIYKSSIQKARFGITEYPFVSHVVGPTPTNVNSDLLFQRPQEVFWSIPTAGYPTETNIYTQYHESLVELVIDDDSRLVTMSLYINPQDINNLKLSDKLYIDGVQYIINKIRDYNASKPALTKVELIKVPDIIKDPEYELLQPEIINIESI